MNGMGRRQFWGTLGPNSHPAPRGETAQLSTWSNELQVCGNASLVGVRKYNLWREDDAIPEYSFGHSSWKSSQQSWKIWQFKSQEQDLETPFSEKILLFLWDILIFWMKFEWWDTKDNENFLNISHDLPLIICLSSVVGHISCTLYSKKPRLQHLYSDVM